MPDGITKETRCLAMGNAKLKNSLPAILTIPERDADALLREGDGDAALLYIYLLRRGGRLDREAAARELGRSDRDMSMAEERLMRLGLLSGADAVPEEGGDPPEYRAAEIVRRSREDGQFRTLVDEVQLSLGRTLSTPDLNRLFAIYDEFALPAEVVLLLVQYCKDESLRSYGPGRTVGMSFIYRVAQEWFDQELMTYELAEQWLQKREERRSQHGQLRQILGITDRKLTKTERGYLDAWLEMGFPVASIEIAVDRTVANTNGMKWSYCDAILRSWDEKKLHTPAEIEKGDRKPGKRTASAAEKAARDDSKTLRQIKQLRDKMNRGESS